MIQVNKINKDSYYSVAETSNILGYKTNQTVYNLIEKEKIKAVKEGKNIMIAGSELLAYLSKEKKINIDNINNEKEDENKLLTHIQYNQNKLDDLEKKYQAGMYEKDYYEYAKKQLIETRDNPPRCPYCEQILGRSDSVFNRELNDRYHICKKCESILKKFLNRPRSVTSLDLKERRRINNKLYFTKEGFANVFRVSMLNINQQVLKHRLEKIDKAIEKEKLKTEEINNETLISSDELYRLLDICQEKGYTFDDIL